MKRRSYRLWNGFHSLEVVVLITLVSSTSAFAQQNRAVAKNPVQRAERARQARLNADARKQQVVDWAGQRGIRIRFDDGSQILEMVDIRNGKPLILSTMNDNAAISTAAGNVGAGTPFNLDGSGVTVGIWDGGMVMTNHQEFGNRVIAQDVTIPNYHAAHVGGTIAASGIVPRARGMAPQARVFSYDWNYNDSEMWDVAASSPGEAGRIYLSNHSYGILSGWFYAFWTNPYTRKSGYHWWGDITTAEGDEYFGQYGEGPRLWDEIAYSMPYFLIFKAAGNERNDNPTDGAIVYYTPDNGQTWTNAIYDSTVHTLGDGIVKNGYDTIPYYGNAKNIMTVGAVSDAVANGARDLSVVEYAEFSSWGPADDGRIKPDIVANGTGLYSCDTRGTNSYAVRSGTSMSCPNACGSAALLVDYYDDIFPGQAMRASTLKGLIIHTADDLGRPGPDYQYGWGLMNTREAAVVLKNRSEGEASRLIDDTLIHAPASEKSYSFYADGGMPVKVTLCWTDPPGPAQSGLDRRTSVLINDLDLKVIGPGGQPFYPYRLNYFMPEELALTDYKNSVDNVEQVFINMPVPGQYTIIVGHEGSLLDGEQDYSLISSGLYSDQDEDGLPDHWEYAYIQDETAFGAEADPDGDGYDNLMEYIAGSDPTDPESVFTITSADTISSSNESPFIIRWNSLPGRIYNVYWSYHLVYIPFENISGDLRWPVNSYTDTVDRVGDAGLYRIDVRLDY